MFGGKIGLPELAVILFLVLLCWPWFKIVGKTGNSKWLGLLLFVALVNYIFLWVFAYSKWPIENELAQLRAKTTTSHA